MLKDFYVKDPGGESHENPDLLIAHCDLLILN